MNRNRHKDFSSATILCALIILNVLGFGRAIAKPVEYEYLTQFEGKYEYSQGMTLEIVASDFDNTLYAVIDNAKYPLTHQQGDRFSNIQDIPVIFYRDENHRITGYRVNEQSFALLTREITKSEFFPRRELSDNPENYQYQTPKAKSDGLAIGEAKHHFSSPNKLVDMVTATIRGDYPDVHSILIFKDNKLILEEYFYGYDAETPHQMRSATKTLFGTLVGIAKQSGFIKGTDEKVLPYFADTYNDIQHISSAKQAVSIEHLLRYRHGLDCENNNPESRGNELSMMQSDDWIKFTLNLPMAGTPGERSSYCTGTALVLGRLTELAVGKGLESFANTHLFSPLGISDYQWRFAPNKTSQTTFNQLYLRPRDMLKFATLYLNRGAWQGKQVLTQQWVKDSFTADKGEYGYMWRHKYFVVDGKQYDSFMASGNGGQKINVWPAHNMITVFTGGNFNSYQLFGKSTPPNEMIPKFILSAL
ncbi:MAG: serine hydrolase domain-containing protein [Aestuariibacter sp.]